MPKTNSSLTSDQRHVREGSRPDYEFQLLDQDGVNVVLTDIDTATVRVVNSKNLTVIQADTDIKSKISSTGFYADSFPQLFTDFIDSTLLMGKKEVHYVIYTWAFPSPTPTRTGVFTLGLICERAAP